MLFEFVIGDEPVCLGFGMILGLCLITQFLCDANSLTYVLGQPKYILYSAKKKLREVEDGMSIFWFFTCPHC